ncbi:hypothetical protein BN2476_310002 [Paraburkholderia piptadeniae]|uniref:Uncharacterized protein n=1 Tax=Paraburkholderia piptadeniae TaxID=1701573 RepID=A0A1N7S3K6_9BURK|nr:hypothetical protein BN2476_310002 [Paraburkholderia piptadeniae]
MMPLSPSMAETAISLAQVPTTLGAFVFFLPWPLAFSCTATQVPVDSFQTDRYVLFISLSYSYEAIICLESVVVVFDRNNRADEYWFTVPQPE